jgi:hypothetical protein
MIRLYLDEDVHKKIALALRLKGYDVVSAHEAGNWGLSDGDQLRYAVREDRAIFTFNSGDFLRLQQEYADRGVAHFGILTAKQLPFKDLLKRLTDFLYTHKSADIKDRSFWI